MVIQLNRRGTVDSDIWYLHLAEKTMVRSYHLLDYECTPPCQNAATFTSADCRRTRIETCSVRRSRADRTWRRKASAGSCCNPTWADCQSFADDLVTERGIVMGGWYYIREATAAIGGAVARLGALLLCLYLGESSAGCAPVSLSAECMMAQRGRAERVAYRLLRTCIHI